MLKLFGTLEYAEDLWSALMSTLGFALDSFSCVLAVHAHRRSMFVVE